MNGCDFIPSVVFGLVAVTFGRWADNAEVVSCRVVTLSCVRRLECFLVGSIDADDI